MRAEPHLPKTLPRPGARLIATETFTLLKAPAPVGYAHMVHDIALYREIAHAPMRQLETASLVVPVLIGFSEPFQIALGRQPSPGETYQSFTSGLTLKPVHIRSAGSCSCVEFTLTPLGARRFFGLPMSELTERMVQLDDLGDAALGDLRSRLGDERDWWKRLDIAEAFLVARLRAPGPDNGATAWAYREIVASGGRIPIERLAERTGWSRKHLASRFHDEIGLTPKAVARIARFERAQALAKAEHGGWADIAAACGYADQAHLVREFGSLSGLTPTKWRAAA
jgi:AraC-like DNA-binding protein